MKKDVSAVSVIPRKRTFWSKIKKYKFYYLLALPGFLFLLIFKYVPMFGIVLAFKDYDPFMGVSGIFSSEWVGFANFTKFFNSYYFTNVMGNTIIISLYKFIFSFPAPIILAIMINECGGKYFKKIFQTISYIPHFISWVVVASIMFTILSTDNGLVNTALNSLGLPSMAFLSDPKYFRGVLVVSEIWKTIGFGSIVYLAAITGVDQEQYEAANMDGATRFQKIRYITLPSITGVVMIMMILRIGSLLDAGFEQIFLLYSPGVYSVSDIVDTFVYRSGLLDNDYSYATAVGMFKSVIAGILLISANFFSKKVTSEGIW